MLKDNQLIEILWTQTAQKHFGNLGYSFTKGETILVKPEELPEGSQREVVAICDCCGKEINMQYRQYLKRIKKHDGKYYCKKCFGESKEAQQIKVSRSKKTCLEKYGVENPMQDKQIQERLIQSFQDKYRVTSAMQIPGVLDKIQQTCLNKYGVKTYLQTNEGIQKAKQGMLEKYGVERAFSSPEIKKKAVQTCVEKYRVEYTFQDESIRKKAQEKLATTGEIRTSSQQVQIFEMLKEKYNSCYLNYPEGILNLDCALFLGDIKIDVEYDGWYWHQDQQKDIKRDRVIQKKGYKVLRIKGNTKVPSKEQLLALVEQLINSDKNYLEYQLDEYIKQKENN